MNITDVVKTRARAQRSRKSSGDALSARVETPAEVPSSTLSTEQGHTAPPLGNAPRRMGETQLQRHTKEKIASLAQLVAGVAHELNTPVAAVKSAAAVSNLCIGRILAALETSSAWDELNEDESFQEALTVLQDSNQVMPAASDRLAAIVRSLQNFACLDQAEYRLADVHEGLNSALALIQHLLGDKIQVARHYGDIVAIGCYPAQLNQVFMNLLVNAAQSIENKGTITIETLSDDEKVYIRIADTGTGISPDDLERIFEPGFTTKGVGVGTGLGLSTSSRIVDQHHGDIEVLSTPGEGSVFTVILPIGPFCATRAPQPQREYRASPPKMARIEEEFGDSLSQRLRRGPVEKSAFSVDRFHSTIDSRGTSRSQPQGKTDTNGAPARSSATSKLRTKS